MLTRIPMIAASASLRDIWRAFLRRASPGLTQRFKENMSQLTGQQNVYLTNSGIASFYIILKTLQTISARNEVIIPAYTAGSLVVAIKKAGLIPVLCDVSLKDFNLDKKSLIKKISYNTLAINCVHMFGIANSVITELRREVPPDIYLIEDCAQAMGTTIDGLPVGSFSEVSFFSFNRGKNFPLYAGGFIATNRKDIARLIDSQCASLARPYTAEDTSTLILHLTAFTLATKPFFYQICYPMANRFKDVSPPLDFEAVKMTSFQASLGAGLYTHINSHFLKRRENGIYLYNALNSLECIQLPVLRAQSHTIFNRFPFLVKDIKNIPVIEKALLLKGIESSRGYGKPLYTMFDLGVKEADFPNAQHLSQHLLTVPVHPRMQARHLDAIITILRNCRDDTATKHTKILA